MMDKTNIHLTPEEIIAFRDGELQSMRIEMHVEQCPRCRKRLAESRELLDMVGKVMNDEDQGKFPGKSAMRFLMKSPGKYPVDKEVSASLRRTPAASKEASYSMSLGEAIPDESLLSRVSRTFARSHKKLPLGKFLSTDLENRPADLVVGNARISVAGLEEGQTSEVRITIRDRYSDAPLAGIDVTLLTEGGGFENQATDDKGVVLLEVPVGVNRLQIHADRILETMLVNLPDED